MGRPTAKEKLKIEERRRRVAALYLAHMTQEEIARREGIHQSTVSDDIAAIKAQYRAERHSLIEREAEELDQMERDCAVQFAASKEREWISERRAIKAQRAALLGLNAPVRADIVNQHAGRIELIFRNDWRSRVIDDIEALPETAESLPALPPSRPAGGATGSEET